MPIRAPGGSCPGAELARLRDGLHDVNQLFRVGGLGDAAGPEDAAVLRGVPGDVPGVRVRAPRARCRLAELGHDQALARLPEPLADGLEFRQVADALDEHDHDLGLRGVHQLPGQFQAVQVVLVAGGDDVAEVKADRRAPLGDREPHAAALRQDGDVARAEPRAGQVDVEHGAERQRRVGGEAGEALAVGPRIRMPLGRELGGDGLEYSRARARALAEPGAQDHRDPHPGGGALAQYLGDKLGPHHHQGQVDRLGQVEDRGVRGHALHLAALAVDRVHPSRRSRTWP